MMGEELPQKDIASVESKLVNYKNLKGTQLSVVQGINNNEIDISSIKSVVMKDFYEKSEKTIAHQERTIDTLRNELKKQHEFLHLSVELRPEIATLFPYVTSISLNNTIRSYIADSISPDTLCMATVSFDRKPSASELEKLKEWLQKRTKAKQLELKY